MGKRVLPAITYAAALFILSITYAPETFAQGFKVGYVDPGAVINRMPEAKAVQQRIQNLYDRKQNEIAVTQQQLQEHQQKAGVISEEARQTEEERLTQMDLELRQLQSDAQEEIRQQSAALMAPLLEKIRTSVNNVAEQQGLDLILNLTMGGYGVLDRNVMYASPENQPQYDITSAVMQDLGI